MQSTTFLCLPAELRSRILHFSVGEHKVHITDQGSKICPSNLDQSIPSTMLIWGAQDCCKGGPSARLSLLSILLVCQLVYEEVKPVIYSQTTLHFSSAATLCKFFTKRRHVLSQIHQIHLYCGPAKHVNAVAKTYAESALNLIVNEALHLAHLHLTFGSFHGIDQDEVIISSFWRHQICRIRGLSTFSMNLSTNVAGPLRLEWMLTMAKEEVEAKIRGTEQVFREQLYSPRRDLHKSTNKERETMQRVRREIVNATQCLLPDMSDCSVWKSGTVPDWQTSDEDSSRPEQTCRTMFCVGQIRRSWVWTSKRDKLL